MVKVALPPPDTVTDLGPGGGSEWVYLMKARHDIDAHLLAGRLEEAGIETRSFVDRNAPGAWLYGGSNPWAPVTVMVRRFQYEDARIVLAEISFDGPSAIESSGSRSPELRRSFPVLWWTTALLLGLVVSVLILGQIARATSLPAVSRPETVTR
ncbi:MAG TPA: DUF2007 domain-containing protein [Actinomycetota bacterium]|nr:DUF2007 domain-containing protein [Actinomycetota bacterium]